MATRQSIFNLGSETECPDFSKLNRTLVNLDITLRTLGCIFVALSGCFFLFNKNL